MTTKLERVLNLVGLLRETRRPLTAEEIRAKIPAYQKETGVAFRRMLERDKRELRDMGLPVEVEQNAEGVEGYRIPKQALLRDPGLTAAEAAALSLAAQAWAGEVAGANPTMGLLKLSVGAGAPASGWLRARVSGDDPNLGALFDALFRRKTVRFAHRRGGGDEPAQRTVDPYALINRRAWYLVGRDHDRDDIRWFRLSRIEGRAEVPGGDAPDFDPPPPDAVRPLRAPWEGDAPESARIAFSPRVAWQVERQTGAPRAGAERDDGRIELDIPIGNPDIFAGWVLGFADDALVVSPEHLRREVVRRLESTA